MVLKEFSMRWFDSLHARKGREIVLTSLAVTYALARVIFLLEMEHRRLRLIKSKKKVMPGSTPPKLAG